MKRNVLTAAAFGMFFAFVLPLQTYLGNASDYAFGGGRLAVECVGWAVLLAALAFALFSACDRLADGFLPVVFTALLVYAYLETGPLAFGIGELDGDAMPELGDLLRKIWDGALLGVLVLAAAFLFRWCRAFAPFVALAVLTLGLCSLLDVRSADAGAPAPSSSGSIAPSEAITRCLAYSPTRNVILLVPDSVPANVAADALAADPTLAEKFSGFTAYRNNVGMSHCTSRGVPGLMTGKYYLDEICDRAEYQMSAVGPDSCLQAFKDHGDAIFCTFDFLSFGYTTGAVAPEMRPATEGLSPAVCRASKGIPYLSVLDVVEFRLVPFAAKGRLLFSKLHRSKASRKNARESYSSEFVLYPRLAAAPVADDPRQMFCKFHTNGAHMPILFDADGHPAPGLRDDGETLRFAVSNVLVGLSRLFDAWREKGVYDKSFIVIAADHGSPLAPHREGAHPKASAALWVKPDGATGPVAVSDLPTGHAKVAALLRAACAGPLDRAAVEGILRTEERTFRYADHGKVVDQVFHADGSFEVR